MDKQFKVVGVFVDVVEELGLEELFIMHKDVAMEDIPQ